VLQRRREAVVKRVSSAPRALAALAVYDRWGVHLCDECEGRLLCIAAGGTPTDFLWSNGRMVSGYRWADQLADYILNLGAKPSRKLQRAACACGKRADREGSSQVSA